MQQTLSEQHRHQQDRLKLSLVPLQSSFSHCSKDPFATGGDFEPFAFSKKLLWQKMDLLLKGAVTDGAWPVEVFP